MTIFSQFSIGRSALRAFRVAMNNAGYNTANAYTPGFSRRRIELGAIPPVRTDGGVTSVGVQVQSVKRMRDPFLDLAFRRESGRFGADVARSKSLRSLEPILGGVENSELRGSLSSFFDSLEELVIQADSKVIRGTVVSRAQDFAATIRRTNRGLVEARQAADLEIAASVDRINAVLSRLQQLNREVVGLEAIGQQATDLRDERDSLLDEISDLMGVRVVEASNGQVSVFLEGSGDAPLAGVNQRALQVQKDSDGFLRILVDRSGEMVDLTDTLRGGRLGGLLRVRDDDIVGYQDQLNSFATAAIEEINARHKEGYDLEGNAGGSLFIPDPPGSSPASSIEVNPAIVANVDLLAASGVPGETGNSDNLHGLLSLREKDIASLEGRSLAGYAADFLAGIGSDVLESTVSLEASTVIVGSLDAQRQKVAGVNLDEEAVDLVKFQQAYEAAARYMQTVNRVTETAIALIRN